MPHFGYSFEGYDPLMHVRSSRREADVSPKAAREVCTSIKGMRLKKAQNFLGEVSSLKRSVPFRRHKKEVAHRSSSDKFHSGKYPVKAAKEVLQGLENLEANAEFKGLDPERLTIIHASVSRGRVVRGFVPRAFGRSSPNFNFLSHLEFVATEK